MKQILVDANVLISFLTDRNARALECNLMELVDVFDRTGLASILPKTRTA